MDKLGRSQDMMLQLAVINGGSARIQESHPFHSAAHTLTALGLTTATHADGWMIYTLTANGIAYVEGKPT